MYGILGESRSDVDTLKALVRRIAANEFLSIKAKGYEGCGEMLRKGATQLQLFAKLGCSQFIVCYDSDGKDPVERRKTVDDQIVKPSRTSQPCCIVVPVQELEAWILADIECAQRVFDSWNPMPISNPEAIASPKEHLEKLSRATNRRPRYHHATHNERMAKYMDIEKVHKACPSFRPLFEFVQAAERGR